MDQVHGVDVSWLHTPNKENQQRKHALSTSSIPKETKPPVSSNGDSPGQHHHRQPEHDASKNSAPTHVTPPSLSQPKQNTDPAVPSTPTPPSSHTQNKPQPNKRPTLLGRTSADKDKDKDKSNNEEPRASRRPSWINNISSRFSSQSTPQRPTPTPQQAPPKSPPAPNGNASAGAQKRPEEAESVEPYTPSKPKDSGSFFSSLTRKLSSASQGSNIPKVQGNGGVCPRKVLNVDPNRERCLVPELDQSKLRRVSFCVDVEIAGGPKYTEDAADDDSQRTRKKKDVKLKERAEGEALKHPDAITEEKDEQGEPTLETKSRAVAVPGQENNSNDALAGQDDLAGSPSVGSLEDGPQGMTRKKEKKKRSEVERKERKEKKLRRAQENGSIPVEMTANDDDDASEQGSLAGSLPNGGMAQPNLQVPAASKQDRPTTDPVRIYRRCCQLRETPILKRITEQLMSSKCAVVNEPGVVGCLDLTGSRLQLADVVTLGDWLAVVPVKRLILEDADLNDEGVRVILAGLLAAKRPEPTKRRNTGPRHRERTGPRPTREERAGVVEKISLKSNPRVTRLGWKHISLFLYMCKSIKAVDLSMNQFPDTMPPSNQSMTKKNPEKPIASNGQDLDAAETLYKCISERLGGSTLEELSVSECGLKVEHIRKITDGAMMSGISRLGLAGNNISDEGLEYVIHYLRSGVCHGLDLGGNDLRGKLDLIANVFNDKPDSACWGLSLAGCNLDTASVKPLIPALVKLPNFRFIDLSHNRDLCGEDNGTISLLRRYMPHMNSLKRIHLSDVGMSTKQAIALAEVLPETPRLAHLSITENPQLKALANATDEAGQEEACALYASLMTAVRVSNTIICIDIDVPSTESNEIIKALAKQVVAYSLRNMEQFAIAEATGDDIATGTANAAATLTAPHGGEDNVKGVVVPDVLMHLIGHMDGTTQNCDNDEPAPDDDYIVGGTGVVKALQYVLGEKANDLRKSSRPGTPIQGALTPTGDRPESSYGLDHEGTAKAKQMSKDLLQSARKIRTRLQPALIKEATAGDEMAYRRLLFLDQTLQSMIQRFEEEYPDSRVSPNASTMEPATITSMTSSTTSTLPTTTTFSEHAEPLNPWPQGDADEPDDEALKPPMSRHNSDASLASRALTLEEGRLHRLGHHLRRDVINSTPPTATTPTTDGRPPAHTAGQERLDLLKERLESTPGNELGPLVAEIGWKAVLERLGANLEDLRALQEQDPEAWEQFRDSQLKARMNIGGEGGGSG